MDLLQCATRIDDLEIGLTQLSLILLQLCPIATVLPRLLTSTETTLHWPPFFFAHWCFPPLYTLTFSANLRLCSMYRSWYRRWSSSLSPPMIRCDYVLTTHIILFVHVSVTLSSVTKHAPIIVLVCHSRARICKSIVCWSFVSVCC